ncbi:MULTISPECIES: hypothetical protein [Bacillus]|uniref:hypothetical protein n=1 Tax=Bacillus TaxID=1386 RepID=UPI000AA116EB|nr:hypothetical protein [Bacillus safensis]MCZ2740216.1 hypothetical protein [Bacillus safensis]
MGTTTLCEACQKNEMNVVEASDEPKQPYQLCHQCHERLLTYSLRPIEWYHLAVLHSPKQFLLHDDFYGEDGQAYQLEEMLSSPKTLKHQHYKALGVIWCLY